MAFRQLRLHFPDFPQEMTVMKQSVQPQEQDGIVTYKQVTSYVHPSDVVKTFPDVDVMSMKTQLLSGKPMKMVPSQLLPPTDEEIHAAFVETETV